MNYDHQIDNALNALHSEGRYRIFQDISRINGQYPKANWVKTDGTQSEITVWCHLRARHAASARPSSVRSRTGLWKWLMDWPRTAQRATRL